VLPSNASPLPKTDIDAACEPESEKQYNSACQRADREADFGRRGGSVTGKGTEVIKLVSMAQGTRDIGCSRVLALATSDRHSVAFCADRRV